MNTEIIIAICTVITTVFSIKFWLLSPIEKRFDKMDERFNKIDERFDKIDKTLEEIKKDIRSIDSRVSFLEGYSLGKDFKNGTYNK